MNRFATMTLAAACAFTMYGQGGRGGGARNPGVQSQANLQRRLRTTSRMAADQMPESGYGFLPEGEPRSFAGWVGHVADVQADQCGGICGYSAAARRGGDDHQGRFGGGAEEVLRRVRCRV